MNTNFTINIIGINRQYEDLYVMALIICPFLYKIIPLRTKEWFNTVDLHYWQ